MGDQRGHEKSLRLPLHFPVNQKRLQKIKSVFKKQNNKKEGRMKGREGQRGGGRRGRRSLRTSLCSSATSLRPLVAGELGAALEGIGALRLSCIQLAGNVGFEAWSLHLVGLAVHQGPLPLPAGALTPRSGESNPRAGLARGGPVPQTLQPPPPRGTLPPSSVYPPTSRALAMPCHPACNFLTISPAHSSAALSTLWTDHHHRPPPELPHLPTPRPPPPSH